MELGGFNMSRYAHPPDGPEVARPSLLLPEATQPQQPIPAFPEVYPQPPLSPPPPPATSAATGEIKRNLNEEPRGWAKKRLGGFSTATLLFSAALATLSIAVVGLSVAAGLLAGQASDAEASLASMSSSTTASAPATKSTTGPSRAGGTIATVTTTTTLPSVTATESATCSGAAEEPACNGGRYSSNVHPGYSFETHCDQETVGDPIMRTFSGSFKSCIENCISWTEAMSIISPNSGGDVRCHAVSFVPGWTDAPEWNEGELETNSDPWGDCFLKSVTQQAENLSESSGTYVAIWFED